MGKVMFGFEELEVWQKAVEYAVLIVKASENLTTDRKHYRLIEQLEASASSIAMNIAEGKGRYSRKEFVQFLYIARGSLFENITLLTIFHKNGWICDDTIEKLRISADEIGKMLSGLIKYMKSTL